MTDRPLPPPEASPDPQGEAAALEQTRAALAPTLEATAAILPWVATPKQPRFPPELEARWQAACEQLDTAWAGRYRVGPEHIRPHVIELCATALELSDVDCLRLAEALATATDRLDAPESLDNPRLVAALSAAIECLNEDEGLEHPAFPERARSLAARLEDCAHSNSAHSVRSATIDRLFLSEAVECLDRLQAAFEALPADAYDAREAALVIAQAAEPLELDPIINLAHRLAILVTPPPGQMIDLDHGPLREQALNLIAKLEIAIAEIDPEAAN